MNELSGAAFEGYAARLDDGETARREALHTMEGIVADLLVITRRVARIGPAARPLASDADGLARKVTELRIALERIELSDQLGNI